MRSTKNTKILDDGEPKSASTLIDGQYIREMNEDINIDEGAEVTNANGQFVAPGLVDVHVHLREPGEEHREAIGTGTRSAAHEGFTTVCPTPSTRPVPDTVEHMDQLQSLIKENTQVRVLPYASITIRQTGKKYIDFEALVKEGAFAFTDDGADVQESTMIYEMMQQIAKLNRTVVAHCGDNSSIYGDAMHQGKRSEELGIPGIPSTRESIQIARDILLAEAANCHYHVCHISTKEGVRAIRDAKTAGIHVAAEAAPRRLLPTENDAPGDNTIFRVNLPLKSKEDRDALLEGLLDDTIDCIATDHVPHAKEEKAQSTTKASSGIVGNEAAFPLLYTRFVKRGDWSLQQLVDYLIIRPTQIFDLPYGKLEEDSYVDLATINLNEEREIRGENFLSETDNTPFIGYKVYGSPVLTTVESKVRFKEDK